MKVLSVKQPWASLIAHSIKPIENRRWKCPEKYIGKRILIHASAKNAVGRWDALNNDQFIAKDESCLKDKCFQDLPSGAIIGSVEIVDCVINHPSIWAERSLENKCPECGREITDFKSDWHWCPDCHRKLSKEVHYDKPIYNWVLANPILFNKPIENIKGRLLFWEYPNINSEPDEDGKEICHCNLGVDEVDQVLSLGDGHYICSYCGGTWYK